MSPERTSRRDAIGKLAGLGALAGLGSGATLARTAALPEASLLRERPEKFWARLRSEQFLLGKSRIFLNNGSLGVMPRPVLQAVVDSLTRGAEYATNDVVRWGYETLDAEREEMAGF
ncbi:MAG: hypothetical protein JNL97_11705, partial [Verrucomicrobiales bacterium]|nr:hypothetical protein [Verrucomicrobiales bacterium]